jgi:hypothetical protein
VHPLDLPEGYHTVPRGQARPAVGRGVAPGAPCGRAALSTGCHPAPACKIRDRCGESGREHLTQNQVLGEQPQSRSEPAAQDPPAYISYYINGYGRP